MANKRKEDTGLSSLSRLETTVMGVVWELGDCTSSQVIDQVARIRPLAPTTIRTVLAKLREKGYVKQIPSMERGYMFRAAVSRESVTRRLVGEWSTSLFGGDSLRAITCLLNSADIDDDELDEIRRVIDQRKKNREGDKT